MSVLMFPGQGSQAKGMGEALFDRYPELTAAADGILGYSIRALCVDDPERRLNDTRYTQPALYVVNALSFRRYRDEGGAAPAWLAGHSLGEYNALQAAGAVSFEDGLRLVARRGALMSTAPKGAMAAVIGVDEARIRAVLREAGLETIDIANLNSPNQTILSGLVADIASAERAFDGIARYVPLNTSGAFHSRYMDAARREFETFLSEIRFTTPAIPVIANVDARPYPGDDIAARLARQITHSVQWTRTIQTLLATGETDYVEIGPGQVLTRLVAEIRKHPLPADVAPAVLPAATGLAAEARNPGHESARESAHESAHDATHEAASRYDRAALLQDVQQRIGAWNRLHPVGTRVRVDTYDSVLVTRTPAVPLFGHRAAIYLEGYHGYFDLTEVRPA